MGTVYNVPMRRPHTAFVVSLVLGTALSQLALAQQQQQPTGVDTASTTALVDTQNMLTDPAARAQGVKLHPMGTDVDNQVKQLGGSSENTDDIYGLAADVFGELMKEAGGDPLKAQELVQEATKNPAAWASKWTPEQQAKLKALSGRLPASQGPASNGAPNP